MERYGERLQNVFDDFIYSEVERGWKDCRRWFMVMSFLYRHHRGTQIMGLCKERNGCVWGAME